MELSLSLALVRSPLSGHPPTFLLLFMDVSRVCGPHLCSMAAFVSLPSAPTFQRLRGTNHPLLDTKTAAMCSSHLLPQPRPLPHPVGAEAAEQATQCLTEDKQLEG